MVARAVRNNNPGNLVPPGGKIIWPGQIGVDSGGFAIFNSYDAGVKAANSNLLSYFKQGYVTPSAIATHWSTTDQSAYTNNIAKAVGVNPNTPLDLSNPTIRDGVLTAIFNQEAGSQANTDNLASRIWADIQSAVKSGGPISGIAAVTGAITGNVANVFTGAAGAVAGAGQSTEGLSSGISGIMNFNLGNWLDEQLSSGAQRYLIPIAVGLGAIILVWVSAWGLVKDTPAGGAIKSAAKTATAAAIL